MGPIFTFFIILSVLILVHELGHFISAKRHGVKVEEFGFGYPPRIWGIKRGGTIYSLNWLPFGGFVRMLGEDPALLEELRGASEARAFWNQSRWVRTIVLLAGVTMNFLLGVVLFAAIYTKLGIPEPVDYLTVTSLAADSPAEAAGLKVDDKISGFSDPKAFVEYVNARRGEPIRLEINQQPVEVRPRLAGETPEGQGALGVGITNIDFVQYPLWQRPLRGTWLGLKEAVAWGGEIFRSLGQTFAGLFIGRIPKDVAGPVGIYQVSKAASAQGFLTVLQFAGILSVNLAILNLLPLPALDGGRLLFIAIEVVTRRRVKPRLEQTVHLLGMVLLIGLMVLVTINDIRRLAG